MKEFLFATLILSFVSDMPCTAQNLVPNPSFEDTVACPFSLNQIHLCTNWSSLGTPNNSPDYFNICSSFDPVSPPEVSWGYQHPHIGGAFSFVITYSSSTVAREYIQVQLSQTLIPGQTYYCSLFANLAGEAGISIGVDKLGFLFSTINFSSSNPPTPTNFSHVYSNSIIIDTIFWYFLKGSFIADSAYTYLSIGNFFDDNNTNTIFLNGAQSQFSGYFIDDVCISIDSSDCFLNTGIIPELINNKYSIFPNPSNDYVKVIGDKLLNIIVYDVYGREITKLTNLDTNELLISLKELKKGIYIFQINSTYWHKVEKN